MWYLIRGHATVDVELLCRQQQRQDVDARRNPAVIGILIIGSISSIIKIFQSFVLLIKWQILDQCYAVDIEEQSHQNQLNYSPD